MRSVELFAGAGGLAMGVSLAGFTPDAVIEWDKDTCITLRANQERGVCPVAHWPLIEGDVRQYDFSVLPAGVDLVSGGPPCPPHVPCDPQLIWGNFRISCVLQIIFSIPSVACWIFPNTGSTMNSPVANTAGAARIPSGLRCG